MKRIVLLIISISLLMISGCMKNDFEIDNRIYPKILDVTGDEVAIEYYLGKLLVLDTIEVDNRAQAIYIQQNADKLDLRLKILYDDADPFWGCTAKFEYYLAGKKIAKTSNTIELEVLISNYQDIPNFIWFMKDGITQHKLPEPVTTIKSLPLNKEGKL